MADIVQLIAKTYGVLVFLGRLSYKQFPSKGRVGHHPQKTGYHYDQQYMLGHDQYPFCNI